MLHNDIPTAEEIEKIASARHPASVSLYFPTVPLTQDSEAVRIEFRNALSQAVAELEAAGQEKEDIQSLRELGEELLDDEAFWPYLSNSLVVFLTPGEIRTFRLPNRLTASVQVSDRFFVKPLLRSVTFPQAAFVLALAQNSVRLVEVSPDADPFEVSVSDLPEDAASAVGLASISGRSPSGRIQGSEGRKVRLHQYARAVDRAVRPVLSGSGVPLILAATEPLAGIYRSVNSYVHLAAPGIDGNPENVSDAELAGEARTVLDELYRIELARQRERLEEHESRGLTATDLSDVARAATFGAIDTLLVDIDEVVPGLVDEETGAVSFHDRSDAQGYGVVDEIARRALRTGARVLAVRAQEIPGDTAAAAILRFAV
ncbi:baeRF11 domain-containing protein [Nocardiopsis valliformis]|uniref:baeRF11 domain-containing protein n=1 Tax=Nocardiopsis valliformis TaxID=239974 RepID=UPI00034DAC4B|nr:hypothetical protein [Nocardiopsis valliformis]